MRPSSEALAAPARAPTRSPTVRDSAGPPRSLRQHVSRAPSATAVACRLGVQLARLSSFAFLPAPFSAVVLIPGRSRGGVPTTAVLSTLSRGNRCKVRTHPGFLISQPSGTPLASLGPGALPQRPAGLPVAASLSLVPCATCLLRCDPATLAACSRIMLHCHNSKRRLWFPGLAFTPYAGPGGRFWGHCSSRSTSPGPLLLGWGPRGDAAAVSVSVLCGNIESHTRAPTRLPAGAITPVGMQGARAAVCGARPGSASPPLSGAWGAWIPAWCRQSAPLRRRKFTVRRGRKAGAKGTADM